MNVFISWSGPVSREVAKLLKDCLEQCLGPLQGRIFLSDDIRSGSAWFEKLSTAIESSDAGLVCMTRTNLNQPWLLYEAGALSRMKKERVFLCGLLLGGLEPKDVGGPLGQFQHRPFTRADVLKLLKDLNDSLPTADRIRPAVLDRKFRSAWAKLSPHYRRVADAAGLDAAARGPATETYRRVIPQVPPDGPEIERLGEYVEQIRAGCYSRIRRSMRKSRISDDMVRANVFVPDMQPQYSGITFQLYMHPKLRFNMQHPPEWGIRFSPGEGGTGTAFDDRRQSIHTSRSFGLAEEHRTLINPDLRWFISSPIKGADGTPLAVMNIDGLAFDPPRRLLDSAARFIWERTGKLAKILDSLPKSVITVQHAQVLGGDGRNGTHK